MPIIQEYDKDDTENEVAVCCEYSIKDGDVISTHRQPSTKHHTFKLRQILQDLFLPIGYPSSVDSSYLEYQLWDGLQGLCSYWRGVVAMRAVLQAQGVGDAKATAMSAALQWALRDGTGLMGGLLYSYACSPLFDSHPLEFRLLLADVSNDVALTLDMLAPYFVDYTSSMYILACSTILKTICGITAGATKGRITQHFAKHGNMADLSAKESTQETLVSLLGMIGGVWVAKLLEHHENEFWTWTLFGFLTIVHVWANYKAVSVIKLSTFNPARTWALFARPLMPLLVSRVLLDPSPSEEYEASVKEAAKELQAPNDIRESMWWSVKTLLFPAVHTAVPMDKVMQRSKDFKLCTPNDNKQTGNALYILGYDSSNKNIYVWLKVGATSATEIQAYVHALVVHCILIMMYQTNLTHRDKFEELVKQKVEQSFYSIQCLFTPEVFNSLKEKGWDVDGRCYFGFPSTTRLKMVEKSATAKKKK